MARAKTWQSPWRPQMDFFIRHLVWPLLLFVPLLLLTEWSAVDLWLGNAWYAWEGGRWALRQHWLTAGVIHEGGRELVFAIGLSLLTLLFASFRVERLRGFRRTLAYLVVSIMAVTLTVAGIKHFSGIPCPWSLEQFGGHDTYRHNFELLFRSGEGGQCFPAGHASGGYALLALYFAALGRVRRAWPWLLPGLVLGVLFGIGQQARGAHFLSHDLWTLVICWFGALSVFLLMRPYSRLEVDA